MTLRSSVTICCRPLFMRSASARSSGDSRSRASFTEGLIVTRSLITASGQRSKVKGQGSKVKGQGSKVKGQRSNVHVARVHAVKGLGAVPLLRSLESHAS